MREIQVLEDPGAVVAERLTRWPRAAARSS